MGQPLWPFPEAFVLGLKQLTFRDAQVRHVTRLSGNSQSRRRNVPFRVSSRSRPSVYAALAHIAQFLRMSQGWEGLTLLWPEPLQRRMQSSRTPPPAPAPISSHFVFRPVPAPPGRGAAPQTSDSSRVAC
jgi:hypothetical protein